MDVKKLIIPIVTVTVAVIMLATVLIPVVDDAKANANPVTYYNSAALFMTDAQPGDVLEITRVNSGGAVTDSYTFNGKPITMSAVPSWGIGIASDGCLLHLNAAGDGMPMLFDMHSADPAVSYFTAPGDGETAVNKFTFSADSIEWTKPDSSKVSFAYTWALVACDKADGDYYAGDLATAGALVNSANDIVLCGADTSGTNQTMYYFRDGVTTVSNPSFTGTTNVDLTLKEGTRDIYNATVSVDVSGEAIAPYWMMVPYEVNGHSDSDALPMLYGTIPTLVIVALIVGLIGLFAFRKSD